MLKNSNIKTKLETKKYSLQFLPQSIKDISDEKTVFYNGKKLKPAFIIDIIHNLLLRYYFRKENTFPLSSLILKEKYGYQYNYYMQYLVFKKILHVIKEYQQGKNVRVYKLDDDILNDTILRYKNSNLSLLKKYKQAVSAIDNNDFEKNSILPEIKQKLINDLFSATIEFDKAIYYLNHTVQDQDSYNKNKYSVESIHDRHIFYHFDSFGRLHTNFTILKSFIRKNCLLIKNHSTCEIDISNSQPLFLTKIINEEGIGLSNTHEFKVFSYLVIHGKFYQFLMDNSDIKNKKEIKELVYITLFGRNNKKMNNPFAKLFPKIYKFIIDYKQSYGDYRIISHKLQNLESNFIFNKVIKTLSVINPQINVITIHDSIIVAEQFKKEVQSLMDSILSIEFDFIDKEYTF
jgi:hypothetical protein